MLNQRQGTRSFQIGTLLLKNEYRDEALPYLETAYKENPQDFGVLVNLGVCYRQVGRFAEAEQCFEAAHQSRSPDVDWQNEAALANNWASLKEDLGQFDKALEMYQLARQLSHAPHIAMNLAYSLLRAGRWLEAWPLWEWGRSRTTNLGAYPSLPRWTGREPLVGKKLLICREGGYGDAILFLRWFQAIKDLGATTHFWVWKKMASLLQGHPWIDEVIPTQEGMILESVSDEQEKTFRERYDYYVPLWSLPACLRDSGPPLGGQYLDALRGNETNKDRIGICWQAEENTVARKHRSIPYKEFMGIFDARHRLVSLIPNGGFGNIEIPITATSDWRDTANIISGCDLVISIDTAVAHLAGAIGCPTWVLLPMRRDWKFGLPDRPFYWYPNTRYFQQTDPIRWDNVIEEVREALAEKVGV
jgi:tetratricopeptide (TPR) repeat protein